MDLLEKNKWAPVKCPKPTIEPSAFSFDSRGLKIIKTDPFISDLIKGERRNYESMDSIFKMLPHYEQTCVALEKFLLKNGASYDVDSLSSTTAMSFVQPGHTFLEEFGAYTLSQDSKVPLADPSLYLRRYESRVSDARSIVASYPRGKNTGLPIIVSGSDRLVSNIVNVLNLMTASTLQEWVYEMDNSMFVSQVNALRAWLNATFGYADSQVVFSRLQHTGKHIPVRFTDNLNEVFGSSNLVPRRRTVNSTIKWIAMALKAVIKTFTEYDLNSPVFSQDRDAIRRRIEKCIKEGGVVIAGDQSRFDLRHGGDKLVHLNSKILLPRLRRVFGEKAGSNFHYLMQVEENSATIIPTLDFCYAGSGRDTLKSGESGTSRKGSYMSLVDDMTITRESLGLTDEQVNEYFLKNQPSVILGDDLLKLFPTKDDFLAYEKAMETVSPLMGIGLEVERPTKFLGMLVLDADDPAGASPKAGGINAIMNKLFSSEGKVSWAQPIGSIAQKTALPERWRSQRYPAFAAITKFFAMPFDAIDPDRFAVSDAITDGYIKDVRQFYLELSQARTGFNETQAKYFKDCHDNIPLNKSDLSKLYKDILSNPSKYNIDVKYELDEILNIMFKGMEYDINWSVVGIDDEDDSVIKGTAKEALQVMIDEIPTSAKAADFVGKVIRVINSLPRRDLAGIQTMYNAVIDNHKSLGMKYSPGIPIFRSSKR